MPFLLLMPSYNQAHYIVPAVRSVLAQDDPDWELWIVDNSSDTTPAAMKATAGFDDPRIRFHHIPERMDPGSCLNWMLERAQGELFSYLHTDNNLAPDYVRRFRAAMAGRPLALAYCDQRLIDGDGRHLGVHRRGAFDLPRLLSLDTLGVPFAATTALAQRLGGFGVRDFADDVRFCIAAHGVAEFVHLREPLIDYRVHAGSRTADAGGVSGIQAVFLRMFVRLQPELETQGVQPVGVLARELQARFDDFEWFVEDLWHRKLGRVAKPWWPEAFDLQALFVAGLLPLPRLKPGHNAPPWQARPGRPEGPRAGPMASLLLRGYLALRKRDFKRHAERLNNVLLPWASMSLRAEPGLPQTFRIRGLDVRTVWAAVQLESALGWQPRVDAEPAPGDRPGWLRWPAASGDEPVLDCSGTPRLGRG
jgi:hypothetical protein